MKFQRNTGYSGAVAFLVLSFVLAGTGLVGIGVIFFSMSSRSETVPDQLVETVEPAGQVVPDVGLSPQSVPAPVTVRPSVKPSPSARPSSRPPARRVAAVRPTPSVSKKAPAGPRTIRLSPTTALFDQRVVDQGKLVTWMTSPVCLLAGHNTMGWAWMDDLSNGTRVKVLSGPCTGTYEVYDRRSQGRKGGPVPAWMSGGPDLVLQTCKTRGMGFALLRRV